MPVNCNDLMTVAEAAERLGIAPGSVRQTLRRYGIREKRGYPRALVMAIERKPRGDGHPWNQLRQENPMGYTANDAVLVTTWKYRPPGEAQPSTIVESFLKEIPAELKPLIIGPVVSGMNDTVTYLFAPDGSKEFWRLSDLADKWRQRFIELWANESADVVHVKYGGDYGREHGTTIEYTNNQPSQIKTGEHDAIPHD